MNKKLLVIPTIILSSTLLLTGCTSGNSGSNTNNGPQNPTISSSSQASGDSGYVAPPSNMTEKYKGYYFAPATVDAQSWAYYKSVGATIYKEDPSSRSTTGKDWDDSRNDQKNFQKFDKMYGEVSSDVEQTALNVSSYLEKNASASLDAINENKELVINRYPKLGNTVVEKDSSTGFYFVIFTVSEGKAKDSSVYGILVPQKGITPDFDANSRPKG